MRGVADIGGHHAPKLHTATVHPVLAGEVNQKKSESRTPGSAGVFAWVHA